MMIDRFVYPKELQQQANNAAAASLAAEPQLPVALPPVESVDPDEKLSRWGKATLAVVALTVVVLGALNSASLASTWICLGYSAAFYLYWRKHYRGRVRLDFALRQYGLGYMGAFSIMAVEMALSSAFALLCFIWQLGDIQNALESADADDDEQDPTSRFVLRHDFGFFTFLVLSAFVVAACSEEGLKYYLAQRIKQWQPGYRDRHGFVFYSVASALGFATIENLLYISSAASEDGVVGGMILAAIRSLTPLHVMTGYIIGVGIVRRDLMGERLSLWRILAVPVLAHGAFDCVLMVGPPALEGVISEDALIGFLIGCIVALLIALGVYMWYLRNTYLKSSPQVAAQLTSIASSDMQARPPRGAFQLVADEDNLDHEEEEDEVEDHENAVQRKQDDQVPLTQVITDDDDEDIVEVMHVDVNDQ
eukprot:TRINITY_DN46419_c0_g1_i1.p2 TRINITY_DN46419_c0_g1~~TRINITY_DN46419_c0_g1_i1.p2  ORF type:complete len:429 (-),score=186.42 TRINITY_DN46419_c0_g1_i1:775-2040(-)